MTTARVVLPFRIGARTMMTAARPLVRVGWSLAQLLAHDAPVLPGLDGDAQGYLLLSVPADRVPARAGMMTVVRQRYRRYFVDLTIGRGAWLAGLSTTTRSGMRRKAKRIAGVRALDIARYRTPEEIAAFHGPARRVSATTYQEKLLGAGLPQDPAALLALARADRVRAWLLRIDGQPAAYICCTADGETLRYDHVGHDPAFAAHSPGAVLQAAALDDLFADRFRWFDFTEGEGQHKRGLASGSVACVDILLLRRTAANFALVWALSAFDAGVGWGKRLAARPALVPLARWLRRAG